MCSCDWNRVCSRCVGTPHDYRYHLEPDPAEVEADRRERAERITDRDVGITSAGRGAR